MHCCLICKIPNADALCLFCLGGLIRQKEPVVRQENELRVCSLLSWRNDGPRAIPWLVRSLKGREGAQAWRQVAALLMQEFTLPRASVLIPVPSPHALGLARALSACSGLPVQESLRMQRPRAQKRLGRRARQDVGFVRREENLCTKYTNVVICDDVITTGATARAAFQALGRPVTCEVWCLADRRPCGGDGPLL
jgi:hypothetical protein